MNELDQYIKVASQFYASYRSFKTDRGKFDHFKPVLPNMLSVCGQESLKDDSLGIHVYFGNVHIKEDDHKQQNKIINSLYKGVRRNIAYPHRPLNPKLFEKIEIHEPKNQSDYINYITEEDGKFYCKHYKFKIFNRSLELHDYMEFISLLINFKISLGFDFKNCFYPNKEIIQKNHKSMMCDVITVDDMRTLNITHKSSDFSFSLHQSCLNIVDSLLFFTYTYDVDTRSMFFEVNNAS